MERMIVVVLCVLLAGAAYSKGHLPEEPADAETPEGVKVITDDDVVECRTVPGIKGYIEMLGEDDPLKSVNRKFRDARCKQHKTLVYTGPRIVDQETVEFSGINSGWALLQHIQYFQIALIPGGEQRYVYRFNGDPLRIPVAESQ